VQRVPGLQATLAQAFACLEEGAREADSPWRTPTLATNGPGAPGLRTVVLRRFDADGRWLEFHTDARSAKVAALQASPAVGLHGWDPGRRVQLRVKGLATMLQSQQTAEIWRVLPEATRGTYAASLAPGTKITSPDDAARGLTGAAAERFFLVIRVGIDELEWLHLAPEQHRRARFTWANGVSEATWLAP